MAGIDVLILGAGRGERIDGRPKAFLELRGETLLERMVRVGRDVADSVTAAVPASELNRAADLVGGRARVIVGGDYRGATFRLLLEAASAPTIVVLDVVHPFVSGELCRRVLAAAGDNAAAAVVRPFDQVIHADGAPADRAGELYLLQKPIVFRLLDIQRGLELSAGRDLGALELLRLAGRQIELVDAGPFNIKLTTGRDWALVRLLADRLAEAEGPS